jgi:hypothetical protein
MTIRTRPERACRYSQGIRGGSEEEKGLLRRHAEQRLPDGLNGHLAFS